MRYRLATLLFVVTVTAVALASGRYLADYRDGPLVAVLVVLWAVTGFGLGATTRATFPIQRWLWPMAVSGVAANCLFLYFASVAHGLLTEPNVEASLPAVTVVLLTLYRMRIPLGWAVASSAAILLSAALNRHRATAVITALSFFAWLMFAWFGYMGAAAIVAP